MKVALAWASFGPYHYARLKAVSDLLGENSVVGIEMSSCNETYDWKVQRNGLRNIVSVFNDIPAEQVPFAGLSLRLMKLFSKENPDVCFVPSYWPSSSVALLLAAKLRGCKCVMMNESHGGTARVKGVKLLAKRILLNMFDSALVGGAPQCDYFHALGFSDKLLFTGYDAVDNNYFKMRSDEIRGQKERFAREFGLPENFILSLGRMVSKKNLKTLIHAYRILLDRTEGKSNEIPHLVFVGSGEQEAELKKLCGTLALFCSDHSKNAVGEFPAQPHVHFYGFRQVEENPVFYALASLFVLPSLWEEWGLVVNEAMASGIPVIVSKTAGCAPDLVREGINGFTFDPLAPEELAVKMEQITFDRDLMARMGASSRRIISNWDCSNFAQNALRAAQAALNQ